MKYFNLILLFLITFASIGQTKEEAKVLESVENLRKLMLNPDKAGLLNLAHENLTYGHSGGKLENKAQFAEAFLTGTSDFTTLEFSDISVKISGKTAIVRHFLSADSQDKGKAAAHVNLKVMLVFVKEKSGWKLLARQAIKVV
jgi:ketosteroid isomerase-like protein